MKAKRVNWGLALIGLVIVCLAAALAGRSEEGSGSQPPGPAPGPDEQARLVARIFDWAAAWERNVLSIDEYRRFYDSDFISRGMDLTAWMADKAAKAKKAGCIRVEVSEIKIVIKEDRATATFLQHYLSSSYCDVGRKTLMLKKVGADWLIFQEEQPVAGKCDDRCQVAVENSLDDESLGGFHLGDKPQKIVDRYGKPEREENHDQGDQFFRTYQYPSQGMEFNLCGWQEQASIGISSIQASSPSPAKTFRGIGLGSTKAEVDEAYLGIEQEGPDGNLDFDFSEGRVTEISLWFECQ